jgi:SAM-dependent methyltransferase
MKPDYSSSDKESAGGTDPIRYLERLTSGSSEAVYDRLAGYGFARRYAGGKIVADLCWEEVGYGSYLLAETAGSVVSLINSTEAVDLARSVYPASSVEKVNLPKLPYPEDHFDVVVALGVIENLERPEELVKEARRVLKQDGVLIISVPDKLVLVEYGDRADSHRRRGMYVPEFRELLEHHFERVLVYRQGAVAGGFVFPDDAGKIDAASVESASLSLTAPRVGAEPPTTRSVLAACGNTEGLEQEEPFLVLDRDRRVFDECEDRAEDVELLRDEIRRMQETEVQAFQDSLSMHRTEITHLRARIRRSDAEIHGLRNQVEKLQSHIHDMENSTTWRIFEPYRRLRARMTARKKRSPEDPEVSGGRSS